MIPTFRVKHALLLTLLCLVGVSCAHWSSERDRRTQLDDGMSENEILNLYGNPDEMFGPFVNAFNESVVIWSYNAKGSWIQSNSVWIIVVDRKYYKSMPPGSWPADSLAFFHTKFRGE